jgi:hypothetical protein
MDASTRNNLKINNFNELQQFLNWSIGIGIHFAIFRTPTGRRVRLDEDRPTDPSMSTQEARRLAMKKFLVAGILGTMLTLTLSAQVAQARDRFEPYRPTVYGSGGYRYCGHDDDDYGCCESRLRYPWPTYDSSYVYRPYAATYRYNSDRFYAPRTTYRNWR